MKTKSFVNVNFTMSCHVTEESVFAKLSNEFYWSFWMMLLKPTPIRKCNAFLLSRIPQRETSLNSSAFGVPLVSFGKIESVMNCKSLLKERRTAVCFLWKRYTRVRTFEINNAHEMFRIEYVPVETCFTCH